MGAVAAVAPTRTGQRQKYCCISSLYCIIITFFFLREAFCGLEYAENAFAAGASSRTPLGELTTFSRPPSRLGRGHPSPHSTPLDAGASSLARLALGSAPSTHNFWLRHCNTGVRICPRRPNLHRRR